MRASILKLVPSRAIALAGALVLASVQPGWAADAAPPPGPEAASPPSPAVPAAGDAPSSGATPGESAAERAGAEPNAVPGAARPAGLSLEQVRAAMEAAEKRRQEELRPDPAVDNRALAERWGVEVIGIDRTSGGYMLDFRFRVVDAAKAMPLFDHRIKPYVVANKSEIKLPVPEAAKVGAFRPTNRGRNIHSDKSYYIIFANPDNYVKAGETVSVVIGDFRVENLTVN